MTSAMSVANPHIVRSARAISRMVHRVNLAVAVAASIGSGALSAMPVVNGILHSLRLIRRARKSCRAERRVASSEKINARRAKSGGSNSVRPLSLRIFALGLSVRGHRHYENAERHHAREGACDQTISNIHEDFYSR